MAVSVALSALLVAVSGDNDMAFSATAIYSGAAIAFSNGDRKSPLEKAMAAPE